MKSTKIFWVNFNTVLFILKFFNSFKSPESPTADVSREEIDLDIMGTQFSIVRHCSSVLPSTLVENGKGQTKAAAPVEEEASGEADDELETEKVPEDVEEVDESVEQTVEAADVLEAEDKVEKHQEEEDELENIGDKPTEKRGTSLMPEQIAKFVDKRKTMASVPEDEEVNESFFKNAKLQYELKNVGDEVNIESRGRSLTPKKTAKKAESRKTMAPEVASEDFLKYVKIQSELQNVADQPSTSIAERAATMMPDDIAKIAGKRASLAATQEKEASADFIKFAQIQNEMKNLHEGPSSEARAQSLTPEKEVKVVDSRKTIVPPLANLSESFLNYVDTQNELKNVGDCQENPVRSGSMSPEPQVKIDGGLRKTMVPKMLRESFARSLEEIQPVTEAGADDVQPEQEVEESEQATGEKEDLEVAEDPQPEAHEDSTEKEGENEEHVGQVPVVEPPCIAKIAYTTTDDTEKPQVPAPIEKLEIPVETPRRRRLHVDHVALDSASTRTPRRGRSASTDTAPTSVRKRRLTPTREEMSRLAEEPIEGETMEIEIRVHGMLKTEENNVEGKLFHKFLC